jgi:hypothetical protein
MRTRERAYKGPLTRRITLSVSGNPKTPGKKCYRRFGFYRNGMTVGEYYFACEQAEETPRNYTRDIEWDWDHGFIRLS